MAEGVTSAIGLVGGLVVARQTPRLVFIVPGTPTSANPVKAFAQGLTEEPMDEGYLVRGRRCTRCGFLELYATERTVPPGN